MDELIKQRWLHVKPALLFLCCRKYFLSVILGGSKCKEAMLIERLNVP